MSRIEKKLSKLVELKQAIADLDTRRKALEEELITELESNGATSIAWEDERSAYKATVVYSSSMKIDGPGLLAKLSPGVRNQITVRVLDEKLLEDKVARGIVDIDLVAKHTTETPRKPFIRVTGGK